MLGDGHSGMQESIDVLLSAPVAESAAAFCARTGIDEVDLLVAVLRLYTADSRIGDDFEHGSGPFADAVDELILCFPDTAGHGPRTAHFLPLETAPITHGAVWEHQVSRFNRGLAEYPAPGPLDHDMLSLLLEAGLVFLRRSESHTRTVVQSVKNGTSLIEDKEEAWQELLPYRADFQPSAVKKRSLAQYARKLAQDDTLLNGWLARLSFVNKDLLEKLAACNEAMTALERDSEFLHLQLAAAAVGQSRLSAKELKDSASDIDARTEAMNRLRDSIDALIKERAFRGGIIDAAYGIVEDDAEEAAG